MDAQYTINNGEINSQSCQFQELIDFIKLQIFKTLSGLMFHIFNFEIKLLELHNIEMSPIVYDYIIFEVNKYEPRDDFWEILRNQSILLSQQRTILPTL